MQGLETTASGADAAASPFLRRVEGMREVQQTQEIIWHALLTRNRTLSAEIHRNTRDIVHADEQQAGRLAKLREGAEVLMKAAPPLDPRISQAAVRLLRALPLATVLLLGAATLSSAHPVPPPTGTPVFTLTDVSPGTLERMGTSVAQLRADGQLDKLLRGEMTDPLRGFTIRPSPGAEQAPTEAFAVQLVLRRDAAGNAKVYASIPPKQAAWLAAALLPAGSGTDLNPSLATALAKQSEQMGKTEPQQKAPGPKRRGPKL